MTTVAKQLLSIKKRKREKTTVSHTNDETTIVLCDSLKEFVKNPAAHKIGKKDRDCVEHGKYYDMKKMLEWHIDFETNKGGGSVYIEAYYDRGWLNIFNYKAIPQRQGYGSRALRILEKTLIDIGINIEDQEDEAKGFWEKMGY